MEPTALAVFTLPPPGDTAADAGPRMAGRLDSGDGPSTCFQWWVGIWRAPQPNSKAAPSITCHSWGTRPAAVNPTPLSWTDPILAVDGTSYSKSKNVLSGRDASPLATRAAGTPPRPESKNRHHRR